MYLHIRKLCSQIEVTAYHFVQDRLKLLSRLYGPIQLCFFKVTSNEDSGQVVKAKRREEKNSTQVEMREKWINDGGDRDRIFNLLATFLLRGRGVRVWGGGGGGLGDLK